MRDWLYLFVFINISLQSIINPISQIQQPVFGNHIALLGQYDSISSYSYLNKSQDTSITNSSIYYQQNNTVRKLYDFNNQIFKLFNIGNDSVLFYGNFTTFNGSSHSSPILLNTTSDLITDVDPSSSIDGEISTVFVDGNSLYLGGNFTYNGTNSVLVYDLSTNSLSETLFDGFNNNSSINSITKVNDSIIFAGSFYTLGNSSLLGSTFTNFTSNSSNVSTTNSTGNVTSDQIISLKHAQFTSVNSDSSSDPSSIICPGTSEWSLLDNVGGEWTAELSYSTQISKFRLFNSDTDNGVSLFRLYTFPSDSIMNLSYIDPLTQTLSYCDAWCPLYNSSYLQQVVASQDLVDDTYAKSNLSYSSTYQEFELLNQVDTDKMTLTVLHNYGSKGALSGIEFYTNSISIFANNSLNEPNCGSSSSEAVLMSGSSWSQSSDSYISTTVDAQTANVGVTFFPDISFNGTFNVLLFTPGCLQDNTCNSRGVVNATLYDGDVEKATQLIFQTNDYDKFDYIYFGNLTTNSSFTLTLDESLNSGEVVMVADKLRFDIISIDNSTDSNSNKTNTTSSLLTLNGIFEFNPSNFTTLSNNSVGNSTINSIGYYLSSNATIDNLLISGNSLILDGSFNTSAGANSVSVDLTDGDLTIANISNQNIFVINSTEFLSNINTNETGLYSFGSSSLIETIPIANVTSFAAIELNGIEYFVLADNSSNFHVWDNSNKTFVNPPQTLNISSSALVPDLNASLLVGGISIMDSYNPNFFSNSNSFNITGINGEIMSSNYINDSVQVLGGNFFVDVNGTNATNIIFISGSSITPLAQIQFNPDTEVSQLLANDNLLLIGTNGSVNITSGGSTLTTKGLIIYDLSTQQFNTIQPSQLFGDPSISVNKFAVYETSNLVLVGGNFESAGSLSCPVLCIYDLTNTRWDNPPSDNLEGIVNDMNFISENEVLIGGNLSMSGNNSFIATYNFKTQVLALDQSLSAGLPGPITKFILVDSDATGRIVALGDDFIYGNNGSSWVNIDFNNSIDYANSVLKDVKLLSLNNSNSANSGEFFPNNEILLITGSIVHQVYGNLSAVFHNGTDFIPYVYTDLSNSNGIINNVLSKDIYTKLSSSDLLSKVMSKGKVVGISLACALGSVSFLSLTYMIPYFFFYRKLNKDINQTSRIVESEMIDTVNPEQLIHEIDIQKGK